jgi:hypothetical protein
VTALGGFMLATAATAEAVFAWRRFEARRRAFAAAVRRASEIKRPLFVVGDPDAGAHTRLMRAYGCGDLCIDVNGCPRCEFHLAADLTRGPIPGVADDSAVVFVSCVFEYVDDVAAALGEARRIAGADENLLVVTVQPWTFTAALYPGARWAGATADAMKPVTAVHKFAASAALGALVAGALASGKKGETR